jgi:uncharacterized protein YcbX
MHTEPGIRVTRVARYPVKSLQGEVVSETEIEADGMRGDRCWGIRDEGTGRILTGRRRPELLFASAVLSPDGAPLMTLPTGVTCHGPGEKTDAALSEWLGRSVRLVRSQDSPPARAEYFEDATDDSSQAIEWTMPAGRFVDAMPLLVLTTASLRAAAALHPDGDWNVRRFRPNLLVDIDGDGWIEDTWCGRVKLRIGRAMLRPQQPCIRCTMPPARSRTSTETATSSALSPATTAAASEHGRPLPPAARFASVTRCTLSPCSGKPASA